MFSLDSPDMQYLTFSNVEGETLSSFKIAWYIEGTPRNKLGEYLLINSLISYKSNFSTNTIVAPSMIERFNTAV